jgi:thiazole synthase
MGTNGASDAQAHDGHSGPDGHSAQFGPNAPNAYSGDYGLHFYEELIRGATPEAAREQAERRLTTPAPSDPLVIAGRPFRSRLILGTGRYRSTAELLAAIEASGAEMLTVALRRLDLDHKSPTLLDQIDWSRYSILPNTAGARTAAEAIQTARLARAMGLLDWVKLEVVPDPTYLLPDPVGTLEAAKTLVDEGFVVLPYIHADPVLARRLQEIGTATVMPLGSPIGSGQGLVNLEAIKIIIEQARVPVVVDAGIGAPSDAALALELGADAVLVNTAIHGAEHPALMADAFRLAVEAGRKGYRAGRIPKRAHAQASSPTVGVVSGVTP